VRDEPLDPDNEPAWLASLWPSGDYPGVIAGINDDDCAVLSINGQLVIATTDFLNANPIAMQLGLGTLHDLGRLLVCANLSDLCGSGASPMALLVAITMEYGSTVSDFRQLISGVEEEASRWNIPVVGGDTKLGKSRAILAIAIGAAKSQRNLFLKNGALPGDTIWVSGDIGSCGAAVIGLTDGLMGESWRQWAGRAVLRPRLPLEQSRQVAEAGWGNAGTDISDGLGADLVDLCRASSVGAAIYAQDLPIAPEAVELAKALGIPPYRFAFSIGGDLQFLVTTRSSASTHMESLGFTSIGTVTAEKAVRLVAPDATSLLLTGNGHRDSRGLTFAEEIKHLLKELQG
jgi:thiamine-monophosphate kinase